VRPIEINSKAINTIIEVEVKTLDEFLLFTTESKVHPVLTCTAAQSKHAWNPYEYLLRVFEIWEIIKLHFPRVESLFCPPHINTTDNCYALDRNYSRLIRKLLGQVSSSHKYQGHFFSFESSPSIVLVIQNELIKEGLKGEKTCTSLYSTD
jgi:hypothetical protein